MTDLQWLALGAPVALVLLVGLVVLGEELINQAEMKRERMAAEKAPQPEYRGRMTIEFVSGDLGASTQIARPVKSRAS
jgi:hypothetical protein